MKFFIVLLATLLSTATLAKEAPPVADDPVIEHRLMVLSEELRCLVCQNESLAGSQAELANDLRREIRALMKQGKSDQEVVDFLVQRYGDFVLYRPPVKSTTWLLWFGPFILLLGATGALLFYLKRRRRQMEAPGAETPLTEAQKKQAEQLLQTPHNDTPS